MSVRNVRIVNSFPLALPSTASNYPDTFSVNIYVDFRLLMCSVLGRSNRLFTNLDTVHNFGDKFAQNIKTGVLTLFLNRIR